MCCQCPWFGPVPPLSILLLQFMGKSLYRTLYVAMVSVSRRKEVRSGERRYARVCTTPTIVVLLENWEMFTLLSWCTRRHLSKTIVTSPLYTHLPIHSQLTSSPPPTSTTIPPLCSRASASSAPKSPSRAPAKRRRHSFRC